MEINSLIECEGLLPPKRLGMLCVAMIDNSPHAKARAQACHTCLACVEKTGLAAVGKKGVLSAAKLLSHETTTYRAAALDLMEVILAKMNGDINRLVRICGPNLSDKARLLLEERRRKSYAKEPEPLSVSIGLLSRRSHSSSPQKTPVTGSRRDAEDYDLYAELPRLSLRAEGKEPSKPSPRVRKATQDTSEEHPFAFSLATRMGVSPSQSEFDLPGAIEFSNIYSFSATSDIEPSGAAAALRARLLKIREKVKITDNGFDVDGEDSVMDDNVAIKGVEDYDTGIHRPVDFHMQIQHVRRLLNKDGPIAEKDPDLEACIFSLKMFHASLSRQQHSAVGLMASQLTDLRFFLIDNIKITVDLLRRYATNAELLICL